MRAKKRFSKAEAKAIGEQLGIKWDKFELEQFRRGMEVELEHGWQDPQTNVTGDDALITGKIALAHLNEFSDYYDRLERMEAEAKASKMWPLKRAKKEKTYICVVCGKGKKSSKEVKCCNKDMVAQEKGTWND